mmetsp:Transcript_25483/g.38160  ORF Transcript_25483/g.38160 Transcript_25483/m.38160 type:complete len:790 (+) Transcript_25483:85-2454(+)
MDDLAFGDDDEIEPEHYRLFDQMTASSSARSLNAPFPGAVPRPATFCHSPFPKNENSGATDNFAGTPNPTTTTGSITGFETYRSMQMSSSAAASNPKTYDHQACSDEAIPPPTENQRQSSFYLSLLVHAQLRANGKEDAEIAATPAKDRNNLNSNIVSSNQHRGNSLSKRDGKPSASNRCAQGEQEHCSKETAYGRHCSDGASNYTFDSPDAAAGISKHDRVGTNNMMSSSLYPNSASSSLIAQRMTAANTQSDDFGEMVNTKKSSTVTDPPDFQRQSSFYRSLIESTEAGNNLASALNDNTLSEKAIPPPPPENRRQSSFYLSLLASAEEVNPKLTSQVASEALSGSGNAVDKTTDLFIEQMKKINVTPPNGDERGSVAIPTERNSKTTAITEEECEMDIPPPCPDDVKRQSSFYLSLFGPPTDTSFANNAIAENARPKSSIASALPPPTMLSTGNSLTEEEIMSIAAATEKAEAEAAASSIMNGGGENSNVDINLVGQTIDIDHYEEQIAILAKIQEEREAEQQTLQTLQNEKEMERRNLLQARAQNQYANNNDTMNHSGRRGSEGAGQRQQSRQQSRRATTHVPGGHPTNRVEENDVDIPRLLLKGNQETWNAIAVGEAHIVTCLGCRGRMQVAKSASLVFCPICRTVSPNTTSLTRNMSYSRDEDSGVMDASVSNALQRTEYLSILQSQGADISNTVACRQLDESVMDKVNRKLQEYNANNQTKKATDRTMERDFDAYKDDDLAEQLVAQKLTKYKENRDTERKVEAKLNIYAEQRRKNREDEDE